MRDGFHDERLGKQQLGEDGKRVLGGKVFVKKQPRSLDVNCVFRHVMGRDCELGVGKEFWVEVVVRDRLQGLRLPVPGDMKLSRWELPEVNDVSDINHGEAGARERSSRLVALFEKEVEVPPRCTFGAIAGGERRALV